MRQLNFYGFRKIKSDPLRIRDAAVDVESKYWKFRHEKFLRGRPDLLSEIRKSNHSEAAEKHEVDALKDEVKELKGKIATMSADMEKLASLVGSLVKAKQLQQEQFFHDGGSKKRKVTLMPPPVKSCDLADPLMQPLPITSLPDPSTTHDSEFFFPEDPTIAGRDTSLIQAHFPSPAKSQPRQESMASLTSVDEEILTSLFALEPSDDASVTSFSTNIPDLALSIPSSHVAKGQPGEPEAKLVKRLRDSLATLPKNMQELFVERLVAMISNPELFQNQAKAVSALATAAAEEAKKRLEALGGDPSLDSNDEKSVALATAVLGAFLSRYGAALKESGVTHGNSAAMPLEI